MKIMNLLEVVDSAENNALHRAVRDNNLEAVEYLVKKGVNITNTINQGQTTLYVAVSQNYHDILEELCQNKTRDELRNLINRRTLDTGRTALHAAAHNGSFESTSFLLSRGAKFEIFDKRYRSPKQLTSNENVHELLDDIEKFFDSAYAADGKIILDKLDYYPTEELAATGEKTRQKKPLLYLAVSRMIESKKQIDAKVMQILFDRARDDEKSIDDVNAKTSIGGATILHWASHCCEYRLVKFLLSKGAIYCAKDSHNYMPKDVCGKCGHCRCLLDEIERFFDYASHGQAKELVQAIKKLYVMELLAVGGARNDEGQTLVQVLERKGHVDEAEQIRKLMSSDEADRFKKSAAEFLCHGPANVIRYGISFRRE